MVFVKSEAGNEGYEAMIRDTALIALPHHFAAKAVRLGGAWIKFVEKVELSVQNIQIFKNNIDSLYFRVI